MEKFIVDHIDWIFWVIGGLLTLIGSVITLAIWFFKRWMNERQEKENELQSKIQKANQEMKEIKENYLDRFERITKNQTDMRTEIVGEFSNFKLDMTTRIGDLSNKLDNKHEPLRESIEKLLKKFN